MKKFTVFTFWLWTKHTKKNDFLLWNFIKFLNVCQWTGSVKTASTLLQHNSGITLNSLLRLSIQIILWKPIKFSFLFVSGCGTHFCYFQLNFCIFQKAEFIKILKKALPHSLIFSNSIYLNFQTPSPRLHYALFFATNKLLFVIFFKLQLLIKKT
jgi:hypothetical protein